MSPSQLIILLSAYQNGGELSGFYRYNGLCDPESELPFLFNGNYIENLSVDKKEPKYRITERGKFFVTSCLSLQVQEKKHFVASIPEPQLK